MSGFPYVGTYAHSRWVHGRTEWLRSLHSGAHHDARRDVNELGARAAAALWAETDSPRYAVTDRAKKALAFRGRVA